jgi:uncharacterized protein (DUF427 family)
VDLNDHDHLTRPEILRILVFIKESAMKAVWKGTVVAEADESELIKIEGNWYFPPSSLNSEHFRKSDTPYTCPWKGECQYFDVGTNATWSHDSAWSYPKPLPASIPRVGKDYSNYVAFWRDVSVLE